MRLVNGKTRPETKKEIGGQREFEDYLREIRKKLPEWTVIPLDPPRVRLERPSSSLVDEGDRICGETGSDMEIEAMLDLAKLKGWTLLRFEGPEDFVKRASAMALERGFHLDDMEVPGSVPEQGESPIGPELPSGGDRERDLYDDSELKMD
ncbi:LPD7 domain-containing protein [Leptospirillum ferriphilum]|uniref:LPD7 domain-containing protein n=1 Tax=Leptospirillum ferriphilum TaxID=178606 RepID=UPI0006B1E048|nr:LPD7 domain-containing protein [Leptospirillum ferriphilum]